MNDTKLLRQSLADLDERVTSTFKMFNSGLEDVSLTANQTKESHEAEKEIVINLQRRLSKIEKWINSLPIL